MTTTNTTEKTFKTARAAKIACTKTEKAYDAAVLAVNAYPVKNDTLRALRAEAERLRVIALDTYNRAIAEGHLVYSYSFEANSTRDLIAANID